MKHQHGRPLAICWKNRTAVVGYNVSITLSDITARMLRRLKELWLDVYD